MSGTAALTEAGITHQRIRPYRPQTNGKVERYNGTFQRIKTWKSSRDPDYAVKKARVEHLYAIAGGDVVPEPGEPTVVFSMDEFGPLNLQPHPGRQWAEVGGKHKDPGAVRGPGGGPPTPARTVCGICSPQWTWAVT